MIAPEVIEVIIGIAASKVEGVYGMRGTFASNVTELLGRAAHGKGVYLANEEDGLKVDLYCYLNMVFQFLKLQWKCKNGLASKSFS